MKYVNGQTLEGEKTAAEDRKSSKLLWSVHTALSLVLAFIGYPGMGSLNDHLASIK